MNLEANRRGNDYETCDLPMCEECAKEVSLDTHLCPHHFHLQSMVDLPEEYQQMRQQREKIQIVNELLSYQPESKKQPSISTSNKSEGNPNQLNLFEWKDKVLP